MIDMEKDPFILVADPVLIEQVLINLVTNSTHALEERETKTITLKA